MLPSQTPIAIVGAGPAGLTLARLLEIAEVPYVVFERDESAFISDQHASSGTLDIHRDSGQIVLHAAGLFDDFQSVARYNVPTKIVDAQAAVHVHLAGDDSNDKPEIDRESLRKLLLGAVPPDKIRWGCAVRRVEREDDRTLSIHDGKRKVATGFRLVVGADGAWSKVRMKVTTSEPQTCGLQFFTTLIKPNDPTYASAASLAEQGNYIAMSEGRQILLHYLGDRSYHLAVVLKTSEDQAMTRRLYEPSELWASLLQKEFVKWTTELTVLISSAVQPFRSWPLYAMQEASVSWKHVPGVTLLGDAAHLTYGDPLPTSGRPDMLTSDSVPSGHGVNDALYDAYELAKRIVACGVDDMEMERETAAYEKAMHIRAVEGVRTGQWYAEHFFGAKGPAEFLEAAGARA